jgi:hypothetical protein
MLLVDGIPQPHLRLSLGHKLTTANHNQHPNHPVKQLTSITTMKQRNQNHDYQK